MSRTKKLQGLLRQANAEQDAGVLMNYMWKERAEKKRLRKQEKDKRRQNRKRK